MKYRDPVTKEILYERNTTTIGFYNWQDYTKAAMEAAINYLAGDFKATVAVFDLDVDGARTTTAANIVGREWIITFNYWRPEANRYDL